MLGGTEFLALALSSVKYLNRDRTKKEIDHDRTLPGKMTTIKIRCAVRKLQFLPNRIWAGKMERSRRDSILFRLADPPKLGHRAPHRQIDLLLSRRTISLNEIRVAPSLAADHCQPEVVKQFPDER
jgi:hypothetical protein